MFGKKPPASVEPATGISVLQAALRSRQFKSHLSLLARDLQCPVSDLENLCNHGKAPSERILQGLAREFFQAELDVERNLLRPLNPPKPMPLGLIPPPCDPHANVYPGWVDRTIAQPRFSPGPTLSKPYDGKKPGWA